MKSLLARSAATLAARSAHVVLSGHEEPSGALSGHTCRAQRPLLVASLDHLEVIILRALRPHAARCVDVRRRPSQHSDSPCRVLSAAGEIVERFRRVCHSLLPCSLGRLVIFLAVLAVLAISCNVAHHATVPALDLRVAVTSPATSAAVAVAVAVAIIEAAMYSAAQVDFASTGCFFVFQITAVPYSTNSPDDGPS
jgi:hypothetical protein